MSSIKLKIKKVHPEIIKLAMYMYIYSDKHYKSVLCCDKFHKHPFRWTRGLRRGSKATLLLGLRVRIPPGGMEICIL